MAYPTSAFIDGTDGDKKKKKKKKGGFELSAESKKNKRKQDIARRKMSKGKKVKSQKCKPGMPCFKF